MTQLNRPKPSALHFRLLAWVKSTDCYCKDHENQVLTIRGAYPPTIICSSCWKKMGVVPSDQWEILQEEIYTTQQYVETTWKLRMYQQSRNDREVFMTENTKVTEALPANLIRTVPGHIIFATAEKAADGTNCAHRWIITEDEEVKCILCDGIRKLTAEELQMIETAQRAGVVFLQWPERFEAMERAKGSKRRRGRKKGSKATGGVAQGDEVPEGFIPVKEAAVQLNTDAKKLRKKIRSGFYEGIKVGGRVYVKLEETK